MKIAPLMTRARGADGFRRHPGGDDDPRNAVPDASGEHGAAGDSRDGHEPAGGSDPAKILKAYREVIAAPYPIRSSGDRPPCAAFVGWPGCPKNRRYFN